MRPVQLNQPETLNETVVVAEATAGVYLAPKIRTRDQSGGYIEGPDLDRVKFRRHETE
jgi:hypothetical protein